MLPTYRLLVCLPAYSSFCANTNTTATQIRVNLFSSLACTRTLHSTVMGTRLAISGARLTVASRRTVHGPDIRGARRTLIAGARLRLTVPGSRLAIHTQWCQIHHHGCQACRPRYQAHSPCRCQQAYRPWPWMTIQPALCTMPAKTEAHLHCMRTDRMREPAGRIQVKIYCIPERDAHIYIYTYIC